MTQLITTAAIADAAVTTAKHLDASLTQAKLAANVAGNGAAFSVYRSGGQTISTWATVAADAKEYDTANAVSAGVFTAPVAGYYQFNGYAGGATTPCVTQIRFNKNAGAAYYLGTYMTGTANAVSQSALILLAAGDTVRMDVQLATSQSISTGIGGNFFQGFLARSV
ncbi:C1q domain containing protein [uncultured Caudovirales phage]|uniref:C1q domain containing protein n=1 Tax=uncultured Caudovirales phage TaxID=2100421 RepID=A0A6J7W7B5_9CAUD|nr:C1q domain containing protein [uncultured Caudovirales phage]